MKPRAIRYLGLCSILGLGPLACQGEDIAPNCFSTNASGTCIEPTPGLSLSLNCATLPRAVAAANYEFIIPRVPLPPGHRSEWEASGLPPGLELTDGVLRGRPENTGTFSDIEITMRDITADRTVTARCGALEVFDPLRLDLSSTTYGCVDAETDIQSVLKGGTQEALHCEVPQLSNGGPGCPHGFGNGLMPRGLTVQENCRLTGAIDEVMPDDGTFVWMVQLRQSGAQLFVPFCATNNRPLDHQIAILSAGQPLDPKAPLQRSFEPGAPFRMGTREDPRIRVTASCENGTCDRRAIAVSGTCSPLDKSLSEMLAQVDEIRDPQQRIVGLMHGFDLHTSGQSIEENQLAARPWVLTMRTSYCTSAVQGEQNACEVPGARISQTTWSAIAWPSQQMPPLPAPP